MFDMAFGRKTAACLGHFNDPFGVWSTIMKEVFALLSRYLFYKKMSRFREPREYLGLYVQRESFMAYLSIRVNRDNFRSVYMEQSQQT